MDSNAGFGDVIDLIRRSSCRCGMLCHFRPGSLPFVTGWKWWWQIHLCGMYKAGSIIFKSRGCAGQSFASDVYLYMMWMGVTHEYEDGTSPLGQIGDFWCNNLISLSLISQNEDKVSYSVNLNTSSYYRVAPTKPVMLLNGAFDKWPTSMLYHVHRSCLGRLETLWR